MRSLVAAATTLLLTPINAANVWVDTPLGSIIGSNSNPRFGDGVDAFLGIQYASVPERFAKSILLDNEDDYDNRFIDATNFGPFCWQSIQGMPYYEDQEQAEDCLFLNIWRPSGTTSSSKLTVMVYIHDGAWAIGGSPEPPIMGHNLARDHNVIVVSFNYRLGIFGFLATNEDGSNGMNGIDDQVKALEWIYQNIKHFGGERKDVTLVGHGVGGGSVCYLSVTPSAEGLFHRGIMQSGECIVGDDRPDSIGLITGEEGYDVTQGVLESLGADSVYDLADPNAFPASEIATAMVLVTPTLDEDVLPDFPSVLYRDPANIIPSQLLVGANTYDDPLLVPPFGRGVATNMTAFELEIQADFPDDNVNKLIRTYSPQNYGGSLMNAYSQYQGDKIFFCNQRQSAEYMANGLPQGSVYLYQYGAPTYFDPTNLRGLFNEFDNTASDWATHGADVPFLFGTFEEMSTEWWYTNSSYVTPTDQEFLLHLELSSRWASFAKTGNPNTGEYGNWQPVPQVGPNTDGSATQVDQLLFSLEYGGFMSSGAAMASVIERCSSFPNWEPFSVITASPTESPTTYEPTESPTYHPSESPIYRPSKSPSKKPTNKPTLSPTTYAPSKSPSKKPTQQPTFESCTISAGDDPRIPCASGQFCQLETGICLTKSTYWTGICAPIPEVCPAVMDEVCGCDDVTYSNNCVAHSVPENVAHTGRCLTENPTLSPVEHIIPTASPTTNEPTSNPTPSPAQSTPEPYQITQHILQLSQLLNRI